MVRLIFAAVLGCKFIVDTQVAAYILRLMLTHWYFSRRFRHCSRSQ